MRVSYAPLAGLLVAALYAVAQPQSAPGPKHPDEVKGMPPRAAPADYPSHAQAGAVTLAAEFLGHSIPRPEGPLESEDYVAIEVGIYGPQGARLTMSRNDFSLRLNGKKNPLPSQPFGMVAGSLKDPSWDPPDKKEEKSKSGISTGGGADSNEPPPPVHVPIELRRAMAQYVEKASIPEGDRPLPEAGLLFFQYRGKVNHLRSIELTYSGPAGKATLDLQP
jgi:hypothetical protein